MKKIFFTAVVYFSCYAFVNAQFGITVGGNVSQYKYTSDRDPIFSWNAGLFYSITDKKSALVVQPALLYSGKGATKNVDIGSNSDIEKYLNHINYLELSMPVILRIPVTDDGFLKADFGIGPYAGYLVSATYTAVPYDGAKTTSNYKIGTSGTDDFKPFDAGLSFLIGYRMANMGMNVQYDLGLANTNPRTNDSPLKMRALMVNLLIYFGK